jgi:hypothetical protein
MTDQDLLSQIQSALMEPDDQGATWPSGLWSQAEILAYMNERQDRFLKATQVWVGLANITATIGVKTYALPQDHLLTVDVVWVPTSGDPIPLDRADSFELDHGMADWNNERGTPLCYTTQDTPLLTLQIAPAPDAAGQFLLLYIPSGETLTAAGYPFIVTNEYVHAVGKYGPLADAWGKDGRGKNPEKAAYCQLRYDMAVEMAKIVLNGWT